MQTAHDVTIGRGTVNIGFHLVDHHSDSHPSVEAIAVQQYQNWNEHSWVLLLFTDEFKFGFVPDFQRRRVWKKFRNVERLRHIQKVHNYTGVTIVF